VHSGAEIVRCTYDRRVTSATGLTAHPLAPMLAVRLESVGRIFETALVSDVPVVNALCRHVERYRGKMLRPTLVIVSGLAARGTGGSVAEPPMERHDTLAAVVEMIHMATLVHDDVLDEADLRRGGATINSLRGNETAVMLGDYLISSAFRLCSTLGDSSLNLALGETTNALCAGEILQLSHRGDMALGESTYFDIVRGKTAVLVGSSCRLGAVLSGAPERVCASLGAFGEELGIAFQIQDDVLDLVGDQQVVGKTLGIDLRKGKLTLPMVMHLAGCDAVTRTRTLELIRHVDAIAVRDLMERSGAIERARQRAMQMVASAKDRLAALPDSAARDLLQLMADAVVDRSS
jgi:octaprenyl-diphosphate synthase